MGDYKAFLRERITPTTGEVVDTVGCVLGQHPGIEFFTVGQRRGLGIVAGEPLYVLRLEPETNRVVVGPESGLYQDKLWASRVNYTLGKPPVGQVAVSVKIRYKSAETGATLHPHREGALVCFDQPQRAITPGQAVVFYQGDVLLGGGVIEGAIPPEMDQAAASPLGGED